jgi:hypothetical protein
MCANGKMKPVETISGIWGKGIRRMMEGVNSTMIYCKNFGNITMYLKYNNSIIIKKKIKKKSKAWGRRKMECEQCES